MVEQCRSLWVAVLDRAIRDAQGDVSPHVEPKHDLVRKARAWMESENGAVGSFLWVCGMLDLDPDYIRLSLRGTPNMGRVRGWRLGRRPPEEACAVH